MKPETSGHMFRVYYDVGGGRKGFQYFDDGMDAKKFARTVIGRAPYVQMLKQRGRDGTLVWKLIGF